MFQGVREVSPVVLANARMLGANKRQLLRSVYLPSAMSWVFSSLHTSVGLAFVGAVVGEYLGSARGVGYLILQAEGTFDINTVFAGIVVLTAFALIPRHAGRARRDAADEMAAEEPERRRSSDHCIEVMIFSSFTASPANTRMPSASFSVAIASSFIAKRNFGSS